MTFTQKVHEYIVSQPEGDPIFIDDIVYEIGEDEREGEKKIRQTVTVICSRLLKTLKGFYRFEVGIYFYTANERASINHKELTRRLYLENKQGEVHGLLVDDSLAFRHGFIRDRGETTYIMTNNWRRAQKCSVQEPVKLSAPPVEITADNVHYLEILELIKWDPQLTEEEDTKIKLVNMTKKYNLYSIRLMALAVTYYNQKVVLAVAKLAPAYLKERYGDTGPDAYHTES